MDTYSDSNMSCPGVVRRLRALTVDEAHAQAFAFAKCLLYKAFNCSYERT